MSGQHNTHLSMKIRETFHETEDQCSEGPGLDQLDRCYDQTNGHYQSYLLCLFGMHKKVPRHEINSWRGTGSSNPWLGKMKKVYRELSRNLHPDKHMNKPKRVREAAEKKYKRVAEAYQIVTEEITDEISHHQMGIKLSQYRSDLAEHKRVKASLDFYPAHPTITTLTPSNWDGLLAHSNNVNRGTKFWLVHLYHGENPNANAMRSIFKGLATKIGVGAGNNAVLRLGALNCLTAVEGTADRTAFPHYCAAMLEKGNSWLAGSTHDQDARYTQMENQLVLVSPPFNIHKTLAQSTNSWTVNSIYSQLQDYARPMGAVVELDASTSEDVWSWAWTSGGDDDTDEDESEYEKILLDVTDDADGAAAASTDGRTATDAATDSSKKDEATEEDETMAVGKCWGLLDDPALIANRTLARHVPSPPPPPQNEVWLMYFHTKRAGCTMCSKMLLKVKRAAALFNNGGGGASGGADELKQKEEALNEARLLLLRSKREASNKDDQFFALQKVQDSQPAELSKLRIELVKQKRSAEEATKKHTEALAIAEKLKEEMAKENTKRNELKEQVREKERGQKRVGKELQDAATASTAAKVRMASAKKVERRAEKAVVRLQHAIADAKTKGLRTVRAEVKVGIVDCDKAITERSSTSAGVYSCHKITPGHRQHGVSVEEVCNRHGHHYTGGNNDDHNGCGSCHCCAEEFIDHDDAADDALASTGVGARTAREACVKAGLGWIKTSTAQEASTSEPVVNEWPATWEHDYDASFDGSRRKKPPGTDIGSDPTTTSPVLQLWRVERPSPPTVASTHPKSASSDLGAETKADLMMSTNELSGGGALLFPGDSEQHMRHMRAMTQPAAESTFELIVQAAAALAKSWTANEHVSEKLLKQCELQRQKRLETAVETAELEMRNQAEASERARTQAKETLQNTEEELHNATVALEEKEKVVKEKQLQVGLAESKDKAAKGVAKTKRLQAERTAEEVDSAVARRLKSAKEAKKAKAQLAGAEMGSIASGRELLRLESVAKEAKAAQLVAIAAVEARKKDAEVTKEALTRRKEALAKTKAALEEVKEVKSESVRQGGGDAEQKAAAEAILQMDSEGGDKGVKGGASVDATTADIGVDSEVVQQSVEQMVQDAVLKGIGPLGQAAFDPTSKKRGSGTSASDQAEREDTPVVRADQALLEKGTLVGGVCVESEEAHTKSLQAVRTAEAEAITATDAVSIAGGALDAKGVVDAAAKRATQTAQASELEAREEERKANDAVEAAIKLREAAKAAAVAEKERADEARASRSSATAALVEAKAKEVEAERRLNELKDKAIEAAEAVAELETNATDAVGRS
jgi:hypothetical protein